MSVKNNTALVLGVGAHTGAALCENLVADHTVLMVARSTGVTGDIAARFEACHAFQCDISSSAAFGVLLDRITDEHGIPDLVVFNAEGGEMGGYKSLNLEAFENSFAVLVTPILMMAQRWVCRLESETQPFKLIVNSSPVAYSTNPEFAGMGPARWAQRQLVESLAQSVASDTTGISILSIDGPIESPTMRSLLPDLPNESFIQPAKIAGRIRSLLEPIDSGLFHIIHADDHVGVGSREGREALLSTPINAGAED